MCGRGAKALLPRALARECVCAYVYVRVWSRVSHACRVHITCAHHVFQDVSEEQALLDAGRETVLVNGKPCEGERGQVCARGTVGAFVGGCRVCLWARVRCV